jgi:tellurite resistance protein
MRSYPSNSPQAAARLVILTAMADGHVGPEELQLLRAGPLHSELGLHEVQIDLLIQQLCEDQWSSAGPGEGMALTEHALLLLLAEVSDPRLRQAVLRMCVYLAEQDGWLSETEGWILGHMVERWALQRAMLMPGSPLAQQRWRAAVH